MSNQERNVIEKKTSLISPAVRSNDKKQKEGKISTLLQKLGNRTVQRLMIQRKGQEPYELDDDAAGRINRERGNGAPLESKLQMEMSEQLGFDLSGVRVHDTSASHQLNQELNAKAFTTGQDVFFKSGEYNPQSSNGKELIAHELTHVVQQGTGQVQNQGGMTVNAPGDRFEQEADSVAQTLSGTPAASLQTQEEEELQMQEEEEIELQEEEEEEELQMQEEEEEEELQMQEEEEIELQEEEEEELQMQQNSVQRQTDNHVVQRIEEYERLLSRPKPKENTNEYDTGSFNKTEGDISPDEPINWEGWRR